MSHHVIYVPGLGDKRSYGQTLAISSWRLFGLKAHYFPLVWSDKEDFEPKLARLLRKIDALKKKGKPVSLVGVSAGAGAVLNAFALRKDAITGVVCIGGKINNPQSINHKVYEINPAFKQSLMLLQKNLKKLNQAERKRIMSIHPLEDKQVPPADTLIRGATEKTVPVTGHIKGIFYTVMFRGRMIGTFLKKLES